MGVVRRWRGWRGWRESRGWCGRRAWWRGQRGQRGQRWQRGQRGLARMARETRVVVSLRHLELGDVHRARFVFVRGREHDLEREHVILVEYTMHETTYPAVRVRGEYEYRG